MYAQVNEKGKIMLHTDEYDECFTCKNIYKCPLIDAITNECVVMHYSDLYINECGLYKK